MRLLYIDPIPDNNVIEILKNIDKNYDIICLKKPLINIKLNIKKYNKYYYFISYYFITLLFYVSSELIKSCFKKNIYRKNIRNCIIDQIEREKGELSTKYSSKIFIRKNIINYIFKSIKLYTLLYYIQLLVKKQSINTVIIPQLDGFPYGAISAYCNSKNIYLGTWINRPPLLLSVRSGYYNIHCPVSSDLSELKNTSDKDLDDQINAIKSNYLKNKIKWINLPENDYPFKGKEVEYYKNLLNPRKKTGLILLHHFTDQSRPRLTNTWFENYFDWFIETINFCKLNKEMNWIFKNHPNSNLYPLKKSQEEFISNLIQDNNFIFTDSRKVKFLQGEVAQIASVIVTCEEPARLNILPYTPFR